MTAETSTIGNPEQIAGNGEPDAESPAAQAPSGATATEPPAGPEPEPSAPSEPAAEAPAELPAPAETAADPAAADPAAEIMTALRRLAESTDRYHTRAEKRESVIDHLHSEVENLRRGERRSLLRPLLVEISRLRHDLQRQAEDLPADFDAERSRVLLLSYAESVELALENNGVVTFTAAQGDAFDPRMHRRVGGEPTADAASVGRIARVKRDGYLDVDSNSPIALAEVVLFATDERNES
ncbi:MAG TPA: nucleotide exchange factor GrpE [Streptosporangiaceae bacterium]|nr:nucleotide exchange factor GrpE [Streptosporangiaceae bacterium]